MAATPIAPLFAAAPHLECPDGPLYAWFIEPPGAVVQLMEKSEFTLAMARWLVGPGLEQLLARFASASGLHLVLDIRPMTSRSTAVRTLFMETAREHGSHFGTITLIPPVQIHAMYLTTLHAAAALISAFGPKLEIETDVDGVFARTQIRVAT